MTSNIQTWEAVKRLLREASNSLELPSPSGTSGAALGFLRGTRDEFEEFLRHNELELAWDALAEVGDRENANGTFWNNLAKAAERMELSDKMDLASQRARHAPNVAVH